MGFVQNRKHSVFDVHEAADQCIQEHLRSAGDKVDIPQTVVPHAFRSTDQSHCYQIAVCFELTEDDLKEGCLCCPKLRLSNVC